MDCDFFGCCFRDLPERNVFDLYRLGKKKAVDFYRRGLVSYEQLEEAGVVGPEEGTKPRRVIMSMEQFENYLEENG